MSAGAYTAASPVIAGGRVRFAHPPYGRSTFPRDSDAKNPLAVDREGEKEKLAGPFDL